MMKMNNYHKVDTIISPNPIISNPKTNKKKKKPIGQNFSLISQLKKKKSISSIGHSIPKINLFLTHFHNAFFFHFHNDF